VEDEKEKKWKDRENRLGEKGKLLFIENGPPPRFFVKKESEQGESKNEGKIVGRSRKKKRTKSERQE